MSIKEHITEKSLVNYKLLPYKILVPLLIRPETGDPPNPYKLRDYSRKERKQKHTCMNSVPREGSYLLERCALVS